MTSELVQTIEALTGRNLHWHISNDFADTSRHAVYCQHMSAGRTITLVWLSYPYDPNAHRGIGYVWLPANWMVA